MDTDTGIIDITDEYITKTEMDLSKRETTRQAREIAIQDEETGIWMGLPPMTYPGCWDYIPMEPYVFKVDKLTVKKEGDEGGELLKAEDVKILLCHGIHPNGKWLFTNGKEVVETVNQFNNKQTDDKEKIEFVVSCNEFDTIERYNDAKDIKMSEFDDISHVVGSKVLVHYLYMPIQQKELLMVVTIPSEEAGFNVDKLSIIKKIQILD